jgi:alkylated DNA repair dioxygenase AlkB
LSTQNNKLAPRLKKRELVVTTEEQYPQHIMIEFTQDKCDLLNNYSVGETVSWHQFKRERMG